VTSSSFFFFSLARIASDCIMTHAYTAFISTYFMCVHRSKDTLKDCSTTHKQTAQIS
jgi:hypothetical protein